MPSTAALLQLLVRLCWQAGDLDALNTQLTLMSKKHGQLKEAVVRMIDEAIPWLADLKAKKDSGAYKGQTDRWLELLNTIRDITDGKIYLELQRARLTVMLSEYHEKLALTAPKAGPKAKEEAKDKDAEEEEKKKKKDPVSAEDHLDVAADLMSEIQIETYSSMDKREKTELWVVQSVQTNMKHPRADAPRVAARKLAPRSCRIPQDQPGLPEGEGLDRPQVAVLRPYCSARTSGRQLPRGVQRVPGGLGHG